MLLKITIKSVIFTVFTTMCFRVFSEPPIVIRHDRTDAEYRKLGAQYPSVCKVGMRGGDGTLIAPQWVLTAAHVAEYMYLRDGGKLSIYFGEEEQTYLCDQVFVHPDHVPMERTDIALIRLKEPVEHVDPVPLYEQRAENGKEIILVGHGDHRTGEGGEWISDGIKRGATNVIDEVNQDLIMFYFDAPPGGTELEGTAGPGDSGGPAFIIQDGIAYIAGVSFGGIAGENGPGTYGAKEHYTRVSSYLDWIKKTIAQPDPKLALSADQSTEEGPGAKRVTDGGPGGGPLPGLGLFLMQEEDKIRIGGKADPLVPEAFRQVMFRPPAYIQSLNGTAYTGLDQFKAAFEQIGQGEAFTIEFRIQGELSSYEGKKM